MKYCRFCGEQIEDNAKFCPSCGNSTDEFSEETRPTETKTETPAQNFHWMAVLGLALSCAFGLVPGLVFDIIGLNKCTEKKDRTMCIIGIIVFAFWTLVGFVIGVLEGLGITNLGLLP